MEEKKEKRRQDIGVKGLMSNSVIYNSDKQQILVSKQAAKEIMHLRHQLRLAERAKSELRQELNKFKNLSS